MRKLYTSKAEPLIKEPSPELEKVEAETLPPEPVKKDNTKIILIVLTMILIIGFFYFQKLNEKE